MFEGRFGRLKEERDNLKKAKEALELSQPDQFSSSDERMQVGLEELQDLKVINKKLHLCTYRPILWTCKVENIPISCNITCLE